MTLTGISSAAVCFSLASCANWSGIAPRAHMADVQAMDTGSVLRAKGDAAWPEGSWWREFRDPQLDGLVRAVLDGSPDLRAAGARVTLAQGLAATRYGATLPQVEADAGITRAFLTREELSASLTDAHTVWDGSILLNASYDLDLWGARRMALAGALDLVHASEAQERAVQLALVTAEVQGYLQLSAQYALRDVAQANLEREQRILQIAQGRYGAGLGTRLEVDLASTALSDTLAQIEGIEEATELQSHQLAALAGKGPGAGENITRPVLKLESPLRVPDPIPAELVGHRPDVVAQRWRVQYAAKQVTIAKAQYFPNINLAAFAGMSGLNVGRLLNGNSFTGGVGPAISLPVFTGGTLRGNLRAQTANYDIAVESYNQAVIGALREVAGQVDTELTSSPRKAIEVDLSTI
jgi:NodT family efflux transporter outer membrane factor (OMF) lipoprotein